MNKVDNKFLIGQRFLFDPYDNSLIDQQENDELTRLGSNESRALSLLIEDPGAIITRTRLHDYVWREQGFEVDDSSLTQAISTLRKALKDSTKSPEFIKTVPKRGYQMIAAVESLAEQSTASTDEQQPQSDLSTEETVNTEAPSQEQILPKASDVSPSTQKAPKAKKSSWPLISGLAVLLALLLPILVNISMPPKSEAFEPLTTINGINVLVPKNHPNVSQWEPMITECTQTYLEYHSGEMKPIEIIATGGQSNQLWINYVHSHELPSENVTLRLLTSQKDNTKLCQ
ncbi:transcriptional regulator [Photobacterium sanctipauli]|uniref:Transcriptional regulator n=1 Tax=Photobacterium sanctipauli TaxID=1342794 RepID=A0A2T3NRA3_9GAMM|nr:transcriptional regulator [Photobacterium sanctipauli]PSW18790.1 transcriptional regulator [Photobacterium sanctipauli]